ncbi:hypothetical protein QWI28_28355 [Citrobacter freundii]|nr:hypothetical protein [Citrobacter freundii]
MTYEDNIENEMVDWQNERTFESIELTTLDHAIAAYRHYKSKNIDLTKLEQNDIFRDIYEIKSIIYSYGSDFIEEKKRKIKYHRLVNKIEIALMIHIMFYITIICLSMFIVIP